MVFQVIRNSLQRIVGHLCQSSSVHRCHRQLVWFCSLFLSFVSHRVRFGREIVEFGGKDGEFVRGRHVERKEREGGRASRLFLSVVSLGCFLTTSARKERRIYKFTLEKRLQRKSQKCGHDNGFCDAKLPSSELQSTCALCILFFYPHHVNMSLLNSHGQFFSFSSPIGFSSFFARERHEYPPSALLASQ